MKLVSLLAILLFVCGYNNVNAQDLNTFTRTTCDPSLQGCVSTSLTLKLFDPNPPQFNASSLTRTVSAPSTVTVGTRYIRIQVTLAGYTSTGTYYLPTTIGESTIILLGANGEGVGPYTIGIYKNADKQFTLSVANTAY